VNREECREVSLNHKPDTIQAAMLLVAQHHLIANRATSRVLCLPCHETMADGEPEHVVQAIRKFLAPDRDVPPVPSLSQYRRC
jgi:dTDP-4-amino-4,6-dideoxygalactose transaminase